MNKSAWWAIGLIVTVAIVVCAIDWCHTVAALKFVPNPLLIAEETISSLLIVTLLMERSLAAINAGLFADARRKAQALTVAAKVAVRQNQPEAATTVKDAATSQAALLAQEDKIKVYAGFVFALLIAGLGIRTLAPLFPAFTDPKSFQSHAFQTWDILLTAGLLTGGSKSLNDLLAALKAIIWPTGQVV